MRRFKPGILIAIALLLAACSPTAWDVHAATAQTLHDASDSLKDAIREHHRTALRGAGGSVERGPNDTDEQYDERRLHALAEADSNWRDNHADWLEAQRAAAASSRAYTEGVYAALSDDGVSQSDLIRIGGEALQSIAHLIELLRSAGFEELPEIPSGLSAALGGE